MVYLYPDLNFRKNNFFQQSQNLQSGGKIVPASRWLFLSCGLKQELMAAEIKRYCKVCGSVLAGRSDKIFCTCGCRTYFNNIKYREKKILYTKDENIQEIQASVRFLWEQKSLLSLKIVLRVAQLCKIIATFESSKRRV